MLTKTIEVKAYTTPDGEPTCSAGLGQVCKFFGFRLCITEVCTFTGDDLIRRGDDGLGYIIPCDGCPVWSDGK